MKKAIHIGLALCFVFLLIPGIFHGQENITAPEETVEGPSDPAELEAFVDGVMYAHMEANHIAGATFSYVKDGDAILAGLDPVAMDAWAFIHLLERDSGLPEYLHKAEEKGSGKVDYQGRIQEVV